MHAATEDGQTFASINGGRDYVDDHTWTDTVADGYLTFKAGTNPYTMRSMAIASLGKYSTPKTSYEADVIDLSALTNRPLDKLRLGDEVTIFDKTIGINVKHKIVRLELDLMEPWNTTVELSSTLRDLGSSDSQDSGVMTTGTSIDTRDLVPFNLLLNARFDNGFAHWAASGASIIDEGVTGPHSVRFTGSGVRWVEQTVAPDTRDTYTLALQMEATGGPQNWVPDLTAAVEIIYQDGTSETVGLQLV
jgi:hypothetical protein